MLRADPDKSLGSTFGGAPPDPFGYYPGGYDHTGQFHGDNGLVFVQPGLLDVEQALGGYPNALFQFTQASPFDPVWPLYLDFYGHRRERPVARRDLQASNGLNLSFKISDTAADTGGSVEIGLRYDDGVIYQQYADINGFIYEVEVPLTEDVTIIAPPLPPAVAAAKPPSAPTSPYAFAAYNRADAAPPTGIGKAGPTFGERILDSLGEIPGSPFRIRTDVKTVKAIVDAFNDEKSFGAGLLMAANVVNPLYHAEVARFRSGEAADRGEYAAATTYGVQAAVAYAQTLALATGAARGLVGPGAPATPPVRGLAPSGGFSVIASEGKPVVQLPALNVEMNTLRTAGADAALAELPEAVPGGGTWATAKGVPPVRSGYGYPGYEGNLAAELFEHSNANGIGLRPHGFFDRLPNLGAPGAWASTHAELKVVYRNPHLDFVEVNRPMCMGCQGSISQIAVQRGVPLVVLDPKGFWYFTSDGKVFPPK